MRPPSVPQSVESYGRRHGEHRRTPPAAARLDGTAGDGPEPSDRDAAIRTAAANVAARWASEGVLNEEHLQSLCAAIDAAAGGEATPASRLRSGLGRQLVDAIETELLHEWRGRSEPPTPCEIVGTLDRLQRVRQYIETRPQNELAEALTGPDGLELAVEVAHDLRSPLTSILFLAEALQRGQSGDVNDLQRRQLGVVYSAALGLSALASNMVELARGGNRLADDEPSPFSVAELFGSVQDMVRPMAEEKGLTIRLLPPVGDHRLGNSEALSRVLLNLTTNAIKFTENGVVEIVAHAGNLSHVEFAVRDTGNGIKPEALNTLYQPFRRSMTKPSGFSFSGTGLGLALCKRLVEAMGSELHVESRPGSGTRFFFTLELPPATR